MELRHFRYFAAVAQPLNYSEASRRLHVAQPAISQTILDLEEEIGAKLFLRNKRNVRLTAAGMALLGEVESILKRTDEGKRVGATGRARGSRHSSHRLHRSGNGAHFASARADLSKS